MAETKAPMGKFGTFLSYAGPVGTAAGAALDIGSAIAGYQGEKEAAAEEQRRFDRQMSLTTTEAQWEEERKRKEEERFKQIAAAIAQMSRGGK